jgi:hypothetical protein
VETLAAPWARGGPSDPVRRLAMPELTDEIARAGFDAVECAYRFRDRVIVKARRPSAPVCRPPQETDAEQNDPGGYHCRAHVRQRNQSVGLGGVGRQH